MLQPATGATVIITTRICRRARQGRRVRGICLIRRVRRCRTVSRQ